MGFSVRSDLKLGVVSARLPESQTEGVDLQPDNMRSTIQFGWLILVYCVFSVLALLAEMTQSALVIRCRVSQGCQCCTLGGRMGRNAIVAAFLVAAAQSLGGVVQFTATVDFETVPMGTRFGSEAGQQAGDEVLMQDDIRMTLDQFQFGAFRGFYRAEVGGIFADFFPTVPLEINNINVVFHFNQLPFLVETVTFEFAEFGGMNNLAVNGHVIHELASLSLIPANPAPGITALVADGIVALIGPIESLLIGGQELAIDNVTAVGVPEPSVLALLMLGVAAVRRFRPRRVFAKPREECRRS